MIQLDELKQKLTGYPESIIADYARFLDTHSESALHRFVLGLLCFLKDTESGDPESIADDAHLRNDLDIDSITIAEVVFLVEDVFEVDIRGDELMQLETVGQLKAFISSKVISQTA